MPEMNRTNILSAQRFNPPTEHECVEGSNCFVYDPAAWRNKNRRGAGIKKSETRTPKPAVDKAPKFAPKYGHGF